MMFGLVIPAAASIGLTVDFGRVYAVNNHTQAALDAAALAAGRVSQLEKIDTGVKAWPPRTPTSPRPSRATW